MIGNEWCINLVVKYAWDGSLDPLVVVKRGGINEISVDRRMINEVLHPRGDCAFLFFRHSPCGSAAGSHAVMLNVDYADNILFKQLQQLSSCKWRQLTRGGITIICTQSGYLMQGTRK